MERERAAMSELAAADEAARARALDVTTSFIVQAPAGSGKTTVLTQRYLRLLAEVAEPEQVLAITFTRKAAGEMRERVRQALDGNVPAKSPADRVTLELAARVRAHAGKLGWGIDESAARLRIQTIDSFNGYLAHSLPITSRSGLSRGVAEEPDDLYLLAARDAMRAAEADPDLRDHLDRVLRRLDDNWNRLEELIAQMFPRRSEWLQNLPQLSGEDLAARIEEGLTTVIGEDLVRAAAALDPEFVAQAGVLARFVAPRVEAGTMPDVVAWRSAAGALTPAIADLARWRGIADLSLTEKGGARKLLNKNQGITPGDREAKQLKDDWIAILQGLDERQIEALATLRALPEPRIPESERRALESLAQLLLASAAQLTLNFNKFGECDFVEIAADARRALREDSSPTPLAERLDSRLAHILVDEFQDTSRDQYDLLLSLTQDWSTGDGRTIFLVGDPMQSIYGFRNAEVGRFSTVRDGGLGNVALEALELRRNFRSAPALVHWCNETFSRVFPRDDDVRSSAVRHLASVAARDGLEGRSHIRRVTGNACAKSEAFDVAARIAELRATKPDESIAVLGGARTHLRAVRRALQERDVPFIGVKLEPLADVPVVRDLEALARALDSPLDRVAWLAVLRAPFVGLTLPDLTAVAVAAGDSSILDAQGKEIPGLTPDGCERLLRAMAVLLPGWAQRELEPRAHRVERVWLALGGASACPSAELPHARRFLDALDGDDRQRQRGREGGVDRLMSKLHAADPAQPGAVALMTIHGAKGLEFDHVFVLGIGRRGRGDEARLLNWLELPRARGADLLLMAPIRSRGEDDEDADSDGINRYVRRLLRERGKAERARQAYVALTRAKRTLHLYVHPRESDDDGEISHSAAPGSLLENLWSAVRDEVAGSEVVGEEAPHDVAIVLPVTSQLRRRLVPQARFATPPPDVIARGEILQAGVDEEDLVFDWARQAARRVGTVVHEELERLARQGSPFAESPKLAQRLESRLRTLGLDADGARAGADRAVTALRATLADDRGRWLFDPRHRDAHSELELTGLRGGRVVNAVIDRIFVDDAGTRWVVDFKTSPHEGGDLEAFFAAQAVRYTPQLARYAELARELGPEPVRAGLYFPLLGAWREVVLTG
jgi:ATP-dependent exoDNAse (exonuclease V) beta subunit